MVRRPLGNHHVGPDTLLVTSTDTENETMELRELRELIVRARVVLWDFDGPVCRLFAGHPAADVAKGLIGHLEKLGLGELLTPDERRSTDPQVLLRAVDRRRPGSDLVVQLEDHLTAEELRAAESAMPTPYADPVIRTWAAVGSRMVITTNNAPRVVRSYLTDRGLLSCFAPHVYGRTNDLQLLKPDPYCLNRALSATGSAPGDALMIGDTASDFQAARAAGVPFLGYARNERKEKLLREAGATAVVDSLRLIHEVLWRAHA
ncbi:HAD family hydrolase [Streptomyces longwoodensis]|uniref:HAD family hydrolase n=1 Tax=Streptomyces longwoodensis TaxID=68231 RepID=UPI0036FE475A